MAGVVTAPAKTSSAESTSPTRTKKESIATFALYFCSVVAGRNRMFLTVLFNE